MVVKASARHVDAANDGETELVVVVVTYVGDRTLYIDNAVRTQGQWPSYGGFSQGNANVALLPDGGLGYFERHSDFEVGYEPEDVAEALLEKNYLAPEVFSHGGGGSDARQRTLDFLGIESLATTTAGIREQLAEVAGHEDPGDESTHSVADRLVDPKDGYTRSELKDACEDLRDGPDDIDLGGGKIDFADWLEAQVNDEELSETELFDLLNGSGTEDDDE